MKKMLLIVFAIFFTSHVGVNAMNNEQDMKNYFQKEKGWEEEDVNRLKKIGAFNKFFSIAYSAQKGFNTQGLASLKEMKNELKSEFAKDLKSAQERDKNLLLEGLDVIKTGLENTKTAAKTFLMAGSCIAIVAVAGGVHYYAPNYELTSIQPVVGGTLATFCGYIGIKSFYQRCEEKQFISIVDEIKKDTFEK